MIDIIFANFKLCLADAIHNFKWMKNTDILYNFDQYIRWYRKFNAYFL